MTINIASDEKHFMLMFPETFTGNVRKFSVYLLFVIGPELIAEILIAFKDDCVSKI